MADDDARLVREAAAGDEAAFRTLVERYGGMAAGIAYSVTGDAEAARDVAQDAFCEAYLSLRRLRSAASFAGWVAGIARRKAVSWVRAKARSHLESAGGREALAVDAAAGAPEGDAERRETRRRVLAAVRGLPRGYREVVMLRCMEGCSHEEIRKALKISAAAVDKRLTRAKAMLREELSDLVD